ncbi:MAG: pantoate kinase [Candidatus Hodarchaeota archaeon]
MPRDVSYWVAAHLTGIFEIRDNSDDYLEKGSRGAGLSINRGVLTTIRQTKEQKVEIFFDGIKKSYSEAVVTKCVIDLLLQNHRNYYFQVYHDFEIPLSSGYGASSAGALGTAFAINDMFNINKSELELFQIAHIAEVMTKSGLGDIIGLHQGGLEIRLKEGAPGIGKTMSLEKDEDWKVATINFGPLSTFEVLTNPQNRLSINNAGRELISKLLSQPTFSHYIQLAQLFTKKVNLWSSRMQKYVKNLPANIFWAQIMLGEGLFLFYRDSFDLEHIEFPTSNIIEENVCHKTVVKKR